MSCYFPESGDWFGRVLHPDVDPDPVNQFVRWLAAGQAAQQAQLLALGAQQRSLYGRSMADEHQRPQQWAEWAIVHWRAGEIPTMPTTQPVASYWPK